MPTFQNEHSVDLDQYDTSVAPPQAVDLEKEVLGSCFLEEESLYIALERLTPSDFYPDESSANGLVFSAIQRVFDKGKSPNIESVAEELRDHNQLGDVGGKGYLKDLMFEVRSSAYTEQHCEDIINKRKRRHAAPKLLSLSKMIADPSTDFNEVLEEVDDVVFSLINDESASNTEEAKTYIASALEHIHSIQGSPDGVTGIGTGLDIDKITAGWQNGDFIVIAARPSMGKTALVLQFLKYAAINYGASGLVSLEMSNKGLGQRLLISEAGVDGQKVRTGRASADEISKIDEAAERLMDIGLILDDTTSVSVAKLRAKVRGLIHKYDIKILAIDYVQLVKSDRDNREQEVAEVARACKDIAKTYDIPVIGLTQLNRGPDHRSGWTKRPNMGDIRESGEIEQAADVIISIFRPEYYDLNQYPEGNGEWSNRSTEGVTELIVNKQRNGPTGLKRVRFDKDNMEFKNLTLMDRMKNKSNNNQYRQQNQSWDDDTPF